MTNPIPWVLFVAKAIDFAIDTARSVGIDPPGAEEVEELLAKVNAQVAKGLGPSVLALNIAVQLAKARADAAIGALGEAPRCENIVYTSGWPAPCGAVLKVTALVSPHTGASAKTYSCDACGWRSA